jgi:hypothetical protein
MESRMVYVRRFITWPEAKAEAEARGGHLVTLSSAEEQAEVDAVVSSNTLNIGMAWIGAFDIDHDGIWEWVDGTPFNYQNWYADEFTVHPDNAYGPEYYAAYFRGNTWDDNALRHHVPYVVEYPQSIDPLNPDTDGDGVSDGDEVQLYRSCPFTVDTDGDGLTDGQEVAAGLNPCEKDSDRDGLSDPDEPGMNLDPLNPDTDGDGLTDGQETLITLTGPLSVDSNTNAVNDLTVIGTVSGNDVLSWVPPVLWSNGVNGFVLSQVNSSASVSYTITVTNAGMVHLRIKTALGVNAIQSDLAEPRLDILLNGHPVCATLKAGPAARNLDFSLITPWLTAGTHVLKLNIAGGGTGTADFIIKAIEIGAVDGTDADNNGIQDWMEQALNSAGDSDHDGILDADEVLLHGTDPLRADTDNDGLEDGDELALGTDALDADTDHDGISDGVEVHDLNTSALNPEFDGTVTDWLTLPGAATNNAAGIWEADGTELRSRSRRGFVEYNVNLPGQDMVRLNINATHIWSTGCTPAIPVDTSHLQIFVDGGYVGSYPVVAADGTYVDIQTFLPMLSAGEHTVRLFWENTSGRLALKIRELKFQQLGGPDANADGVKDWLQVSLLNTTSVDSPLQSVVSPICLEGKALYPELATIQTSCSITNNEYLPTNLNVTLRQAGGLGPVRRLVFQAICGGALRFVE